MANSFQDLSQVLVPLKDTFPPQVLSGSGNGTGIDVEDVGTNVINARLSVGDVDTLTSLDVKMQAGIDDANYVDIDGATFTQVTAADPNPEVIMFQMPRALTVSGSPYNYVRAVATLVGTSVNFSVSLLACRRYDGAAGWVNTRPTIN